MKPPLALVNLSNRNRLFPLFKPEVSLTRVRLRVIIPPHYQQEPVISSLVSQYALSVNISGKDGLKSIKCDNSINKPYFGNYHVLSKIARLREKLRASECPGLHAK